MAHLHMVSDDDRYFSIDPYTKAITYLNEEPLILAQSDHNSELFTFEIPRYVEGHDMMQCNRVEIHYINIASGNTNKRVSDVYDVVDLQVSANDDDTVMFTWLISQNATMHVGSLNFAVRFACVTGSKVDYSWRSSAFSGISIVDSIDNANIVVEQYSDILQSWYMELLMAGTEGVNMVEVAANEQIERIKAIDIVVEIEQDTIDRIEAAGDDVIENIKKEIYAGETALIDTLPVYDGDTEVVV